MNPRFPLTAKILLWFSANLLLLMFIAWLGLRFATRSGFDSFLAGHVGGRVESTARAILGELESKPHGEWNGVLARYGEVHGVKFILLGEELQTLAGEEVDLPESLRSQLPRPPRGGDGLGPSAAARRPASQAAAATSTRLARRAPVARRGHRWKVIGPNPARPAPRRFTAASSCSPKTRAPIGSA